jgi:hypothetical protein
MSIDMKTLPSGTKISRAALNPLVQARVGLQ